MSVDQNASVGCFLFSVLGGCLITMEMIQSATRPGGPTVIQSKVKLFADQDRFFQAGELDG